MFYIDKIWNAVSTFVSSMNSLSATVNEVNTNLRDKLRLDAIEDREGEVVPAIESQDASVRTKKRSKR